MQHCDTLYMEWYYAEFYHKARSTRLHTTQQALTISGTFRYQYSTLVCIRFLKFEGVFHVYACTHARTHARTLSSALHLSLPLCMSASLPLIFKVLTHPSAVVTWYARLGAAGQLHGRVLRNRIRLLGTVRAPLAKLFLSCAPQPKSYVKRTHARTHARALFLSFSPFFPPSLYLSLSLSDSIYLPYFWQLCINIKTNEESTVRDDAYLIATSE